MNETIEDGIGQGWVADGLVPVLDWQLACDDRGGAAMAVFEDFQQVTTFRGCEDGEAPIVDDQHIHAGDGFEDAFMAAIPACKSEGFEHARGALIEDGPTVTARLMAKGAGDPAFAQTGQANDILPAVPDLRFGFGIRFTLGLERLCKLPRRRSMVGPPI